MHLTAEIMQPRIEILREKKLIGMKQTMSLTKNKTGELWRRFIPRLNEINNRTTNEYISLQIYSPTYFSNFNPNNEFDKWATVAVNNFNHVPTEMETLTLTGGQYAVFDYKGSSNDPSVFQYIFTKWLPNSAYQLDNKPHFEVLGEKYKNNDPNSEEEIWIPIKEKS